MGLPGRRIMKCQEGDEIAEDVTSMDEVKNADFLAQARKAKVKIGKIRMDLNTARRRLVSLPLSTQEPLYGLPAIQPTGTIHAVENAGADGMPLGQLAAIPIATVLIGFTLFRSVKALLKRFEPPKKGRPLPAATTPVSRELPIKPLNFPEK